VWKIRTVGDFAKLSVGDVEKMAGGADLVKKKLLHLVKSGPFPPGDAETSASRERIIKPRVMRASMTSAGELRVWKHRTPDKEVF
jgi:hypothetical protein